MCEEVKWQPVEFRVKVFINICVIKVKVVPMLN
jgi:hypothetical protein